MAFSCALSSLRLTGTTEKSATRSSSVSVGRNQEKAFSSLVGCRHVYGLVPVVPDLLARLPALPHRATKSWLVALARSLTFFFFASFYARRLVGWHLVGLRASAVVVPRLLCLHFRLTFVFFVGLRSFRFFPSLLSYSLSLFLSLVSSSGALGQLLHQRLHIHSLPIYLSPRNAFLAVPWPSSCPSRHMSTQT
ncbi:hypothetical protein BC567DRAFT_228162 [Phyllosticta citribraziliensis]